MSSNSTDKDSRPLLGIYAPELTGFYFGELVGQLLTLCRLKNYRATVIKTGSLGQFKSKIHSEAMDMVIVLRNAIHIELAEYFVKEGKQIVAISYDYFPLKIPLVSGDNRAGIELAVTHLMAEDHKKYLFVGNLTNYDIRKRYEAFCEALEMHHLETGEEEVYPVDDDLISGGYEAADRYCNEKCTATAVICGTAMNGIGFSTRMERLAPDLKNLISIVAFDAISLIPVLNPEIVTVDQNLNLIAYKALSIVDKKANSNPDVNHHTVEPKLLSRDSDFMQSADAYLATSFEVAELYNANYMKSIIGNFSEWSHSIARSKLDNIMVLRSLFKNLLASVSMSRAVSGKSGMQYLVYTKLVSTKEVINVDVKDAASVSVEKSFPSRFMNLDPSIYDTYIHVPRFVNGQVWGFVSIYGKVENNELPCSYSGLAAYVENIVEWITHDASIKQAGRKIGETSETTKGTECEIIWKKEEGEVVWGDAALELLGFTGELEKKIYKNMDLFDRLESKCTSELREYLVGGQANNLPIEVRYRDKTREFVTCELRIDGEDKNKNTVIKISVSSGGG